MVVDHYMCSAWDKQECILYLLLEYAEMDLGSVIRSEMVTLNRMSAIQFYWNQMIQIVKVQ